MVENKSFRVLLTRPIEETGPMAKMLEAHGHHVIVNPLLTIISSALAPLDSLPKAWLLTSKQAVAALCSLDPGRARPVFAVGSSTQAACQQAGFQAFDGGGDGAQLIDFIHSSDLPGTAPYIHLSGEDVRVDITQSLLKKGIPCKRYVVYQAKERPVMGGPLQEALTHRTLTHAPFYSVRTARIFAGLLKSYPLFSVKDVCLLALSKAILDELVCFQLRAQHIVRDPLGWLCEKG